MTAMRSGYWIILDELNLASTEVLEALNRVHRVGMPGFFKLLFFLLGCSGIR